jgi:plasmid stabilization system protein ParE
VIVVISAEAEADLDQIAAYVAERSPQSALRLIRELRNSCESLLDAPRGYPLVPTLRAIRHSQSFPWVKEFRRHLSGILK